MVDNSDWCVTDVIAEVILLNSHFFFAIFHVLELVVGVNVSMNGWLCLQP